MNMKTQFNKEEQDVAKNIYIFDYWKYKRMPKPSYKDNNGYFNNNRTGDSPRYMQDPITEWHYGMHRNDTIRIPSMKRGKSTWKRFYRLFPELRYMDTFRGQKLKKI